MAKYIVNVIFLLTCLIILSDVVSGFLCLHNPYCYCTSSKKTGETKIYCNNVDNVQPIDQLLANYSHVYSLRMHGKYLTSIPNKMFAKRSIKVLEISGPLNTMPDDALISIKDLEIVNFNGTNFTAIPSGLPLPTFRIVEMTHGLLSRIDNQLQNLTSATALLLNNNRLSYISPKAFSNTNALQNLDLSNNLITFLNASVFDPIPQLKTLNLANNYLQTVDGLFRKLNPERLILYGNNLSNVSDAFHQGMYNMKWLDLGGNPKLSISKGNFNNSMKFLSTLKLNDNEFETLETDLLYNFYYLQNLFLSNNNLTRLPPDFFAQNVYLKTIEIRSNNFTSIKDIVSFNNSINDSTPPADKESFYSSILLLDISGNQIEVMKKNDLRNFTSMTFLNLSGNPLSEIEAGCFDNQGKLLKLDLSYSRLTTLNHTIRNLSSLAYLKVINSSLGSLNGELENLKNLKYAYFRNNNIASAHEAFKNTRNLTSLDISGNNLTTLTVNSSFEGKDKNAPLRKLWIADNPLSCDCSLLWILNWLEKNDSKLEDEPKCVSPLNLKGKSLKKLNQSDLEQWADDCPENCDCKCIATMEYVSTSVNCTNRRLSSQPEKFPRNVARIDLNNNRLTSFENFNALDYSNLRILKMENNELEELKMTLPAVISLYLAHNNLKRIPFEEWNRTSFDQITLSMNPWVCDCETWQFRQWFLLHNKSIQDLDEIKCGSSETFSNQAISQLSYGDLCPEYQKYTILIITAVLCASILLVTCLLVCVFRKLLAAILYSCGCSCVKKGERENFLFDAFLLYADEDDEFAIGKIAEGLESDAASYKLFVPTRQILLTSSPVNVNSSIADCSKVIVILTSNFLRNSQCLQLLKTAMACSIQYSSQRFIFIVKDGLPLEVKLDVILDDLIKKSVLLKWEELLFWQKLKYRLPKKVNKVQNSGDEYERLIQA